MNVRIEGMGYEQLGDLLAILTPRSCALENRLANQLSQWSPVAPETADLTVEGDEVYTRVDKNLPPVSAKDGRSTSSHFGIFARAGLLL